MERRNLTVLAAATLIAGGLVAAGIGYGATSPSGPKACETASHVLVLANRNGHCPCADHVVRLGADGPRGLRGLQGRIGAAGPGARSWNQIDLNAPTLASPPLPTTITITGPLTLSEQCWKNPETANVTARLSVTSSQAFSLEELSSASTNSGAFRATAATVSDATSYPLVTSSFPPGNNNDVFLNPVLIWFGSGASAAVYSISAHVYLDSGNKLCTFGGVVSGSRK